MAKGITKAIRRVHKAVRAEIRANAQGNQYAAGLSGEGYAGGYLQALDDVIAALNGISVSNSRYRYQWHSADALLPDNAI
jgi:hypothetical protein